MPEARVTDQRVTDQRVTRGGDAPWPASRQAWWAVAVLTIAYFFSFVDRQLLTLLVAPIRRDLGISDTQLSLLIGFSFAVFYSLFGLPLGRLADRTSRRALVAGGMVLWSLMTALCGLAGSYPLLFLCRIGVGIGEAALSPSAYSMIADLFPPARRAQALSVYAAGIYLGGGAASVIGGVFQQVSAATVNVPLLGALRPWEAIFVAVGVPGILAAALMATVREPVRRGPGATAGAVPLRAVLAFYRANARALIAHHAGFGLMALGGYAIIAWGPTVFIRHFGWTSAETGVSFGIMGVVTGIAGALTGGRVAAWLDARGHAGASELRVGMCAAIACAGLYTAFALTSNARLSFGLLSAGQFFSAFPWGIAAAAIARVAPNAMRAQVSALYLLAINLVGLGAGPTIVALLTDRVFGRDDAVHLSLLVVCLAAYLAGALVLRSGIGPMRASAAHLERGDDMVAARP